MSKIVFEEFHHFLCFIDNFLVLVLMELQFAESHIRWLFCRLHKIRYFNFKLYHQTIVIFWLLLFLLLEMIKRNSKWLKAKWVS